MSLASVTEEQRKCVKENMQFDEVQMQNKIEQVKEWMKKQPHLPKVPDKIADRIIHAFLLGTKLSTERVKYKIDTYYAMRHQIPEIFLNKDPTLQNIRDSVDVIRLFLLSELTPEAIRVSIISYNSAKDKKFTTENLKAYYKRVIMLSEARWQQSDFFCGDYLVIDCRGFYLSHITELPWLFIQRMTSLLQEGLPLRVKGVFVINAATYVETAVNIMKPVLKEKIRNRIHIFQDHTKLYKYIPQRILPSDFGGEAPSIEESSRAWQKTIESMRDFLIEDGKRITDESKRPVDSTNDCGQLFGVNGAFNKLNID